MAPAGFFEENDERNAEVEKDGVLVEAPPLLLLITPMLLPNLVLLVLEELTEAWLLEPRLKVVPPGGGGC